MKFASNKIDVMKSFPENLVEKTSTPKNFKVEKYKRKEY